MNGPNATLNALAFLFWLLPFEPGVADSPPRDFSDFTPSQLKRRLVEIDEAVVKLPTLSLSGGVGPIGFRSMSFENAKTRIWAQIDLEEEHSIDQIVLVPTIWRDAKTGFVADGFPREFEVIVGTDRDSSGVVVARIDDKSSLLPRIAPVIIDLPHRTKASWVRVVALTLSRRIWDGNFNLQLSEILVFSGEENVALHKQVSVSDDAHKGSKSLQKDFLVDGSLPYLMDAAKGKKSIAFVSYVEVGKQLELTIDLGKVLPVDRIHLHGPDLSDTVPQSVSSDYGIPRHIQILGASQEDFSDAVTLCEMNLESVYDIAPIIMKRFPVVDCRYVRIVGSDSARNAIDQNSESPNGYAEIEVFSEGVNVAFEKPVTITPPQTTQRRHLSALTDGFNFYGEILPIRGWLEGLAERHDLETQRPFIARELNQRYEQQAANLERMTWLAVILAVGIGFTVLLSRMVQMRQLNEIKRRFAADLHDELGANLHTIGLLSDLADDVKESPEDLSTFLQRIRGLTERTGVAMRHCTDMQNSSELYAGFQTDMYRTAERIAVNLEHDLLVTGEPHLNRLKPQTRFDLFLFYKECLVNICRHSGATQLVTRLAGSEKEVNLTVSDNGIGLSGSTAKGVPPSLRRRAKLLGAKISVDCPTEGGTCIQLSLRSRRWGFRR
ncbi:sensory histidine kinase UhpB [Novipirellula aureliae]|uniref:histidine kinase n=1 Tax=Novipirellula aureliae TaxID=2527966 RepID=A0A5C6DQ49_9BACT|nr:histidine kinase [Novipirellula aureliae]TWU38878.1 sensory histidine kinase UhpB [Novipirellula aureliae]